MRVRFRFAFLLTALSAAFSLFVAPAMGQSAIAWGDNQYAQLGIGDSPGKPRPAHRTNVASVSAGQSHSLAVKPDGTGWARGYNGHGEFGDGTTKNGFTPVRVTGLMNVAAVSAGWTHSLAVVDSRPPYWFSDAARAARIAAGLLPATAYESVWLDVTGQGGQGLIDLPDALLITRKVAGVSTNPKATFL